MIRVLAGAALSVASKCPPEGFDSVSTFDLDTFISDRWYVQQMMEGGLEPKKLFQCQYAEYQKFDKPNFWGFELQGHDHIDMMDGTNFDLHPCAKIVDEKRGKLAVGECGLPSLLMGPYWVYAYNETAGYAAVGGGAPKHEFPGGCRTGTGKIGGGLWIFTRQQTRDEAMVGKVRTFLQGQGFDLDALQDVDQSGCPTEEGPFPHHPKPKWDEKAAYARWLVHEADYASIITHHNGADVFGNIISTTDGLGFTDGNASGIVYTFMPSLDATYQDLIHDYRVSLHFAEKSLAGNSCPGLPESGSCGRLTMNGVLTPVPDDQKDAALQFIIQRDPQAKLWALTHGFVPFWMAAENITSITWYDAKGTSESVEVEDYLASSPFRTAVPTLGSSAVVAHAPKSYNPRPHFFQHPELARWLVHESDFVALGIHNGSDVLGIGVSISDGDGYADSTGVIYTYLPTNGPVYSNLMVDSRVSLTFSEMAIANGTAPGCKGATGESPPCIRLTMTGRLTPVPEVMRTEALQHLFHRHPEMQTWADNSTEYVPFWVDPQHIDEFFLIPFYGGAEHFTPEAYLAARWYRGGPLPAPVPTPAPTPAIIKYACRTCGHVYNADLDGGGLDFADLPDDWVCPVCAAKKSAYHPITFTDESFVV